MIAMPALEVELAYRACEEITRREAANFYYGIRLLPRDKRQAMSAVYAFARRVDDIGDGHDETPAKLAALEASRDRLATIGEGVADGRYASGGPCGDPVTIALADAHGRFDMPLEALELLIEGVELDVRGTRYETFEELVVYCRDVAGSIGRLCLAIFTAGDGNGHAMLADDLGVAMQLTNILRDVREDAENGRVYLPLEDLRRFGLLEPASDGDEDGREVVGAGERAAERLGALARAAAREPGVQPGESESLERLADLVRFEAARARVWFARGGRLAPLLDRRSAACLLAMAGIYARLLDRIEAHPLQAVGRRMSLPAQEKAWVALRGMLGVGL
jgi:phytoene synthase